MFAIDVVSRIVHVLTAITLVGGSIFTLLVLMPSAKQLSTEAHDQLAAAVNGRWKKLVHFGVLLFLISGFYNYFRASSATQRRRALSRTDRHKNAVGHFASFTWPPRWWDGAKNWPAFEPTVPNGSKSWSFWRSSSSASPASSKSAVSKQLLPANTAITDTT